MIKFTTIIYQGYIIITLLTLITKINSDEILVRVSPENIDQERYLQSSVLLNANGINVLSPPTLSMPGEMLVRRLKYNKFVRLMRAKTIPFKKVASSVNRLVKEEKMLNEKAKEKQHQSENKMQKRDGKTVFSPINYYARYDEIQTWLRHLSQRHSALLRVKSMGMTYENRSHTVIEFGLEKNKKLILLEAGMHAREWLSTATTMYIFDKLFKAVHSPRAAMKREIIQFLGRYTFVIIPVANPDGYEYSHERSRFWRKTRRPYIWYCPGADPNRNFDADFFADLGRYSSTKPCSPIFRGPRPFSEKNTRNIANYLKAHIASGKKIVLAWTMHAYSKLWLLPGGTAKLDIQNNTRLEELQAVTRVGIRTLEENGAGRWKSGIIREVIYPAAGSSTDYYYQTLNVTFPIALELPPSKEEAAQRGTSGFLVSPSEIPKCGRQLYNTLIATLKEVKKLGY